MTIPHHLASEADAWINILRDWAWPIMVVGYYAVCTFLCLDGFCRELMGRHGHNTRIHYLIWQYHTGLHIHPMRTYGGEKRLSRTASASNRATPEGQIVYFNPRKRRTRILWRNGIVLLIISLFYGLIFDGKLTVQWTAAFLTIALVALMGVSIEKVRKRLRARPARQLATRPLTARVPAVAGNAKPEKLWLSGGEVTDQKPTLAGGVPTPVMATLLSKPIGTSTDEAARNLTIGDDQGKLMLPDYFAATDNERDSVEEIIRANTKGSIQFRWRTNEQPRYVSWEPVETSLPKLALFRDYAAQMEKLDPLTFGIGLTIARKMYTETHGGDLTWWVRCAGPGTGKSTGFQIKLAQICRKDPDAQVYCIDTKQVSFHDMHGIPNVHIFDDPEAHMGDIWRVFGVMTGIMRDRYSAVRRHEINRATGKPFKFQDFENMWVLVDEGNDLAGMLSQWWKTRLKQSGDPATAPVWMDCVAPLLNLGREAGFHGEWMFQNFTDKAMGGISLRDAFPVREMAGYTPNQWTRVVGSKYKEPKLGPGRICMCKGPDEVWVQGFYDDSDWLREYALNGRPEVRRAA